MLDAKTIQPLPNVRVFAFANPAALLPELRTDASGRYELRTTNGAVQQILVSLPVMKATNGSVAPAKPIGRETCAWTFSCNRIKQPEAIHHPGAGRREKSKPSWKKVNGLEKLPRRASMRLHGLYVQTQKDHALARIARDAAELGDADLARKALQGITSAHERDVVAFASARALASRGQRGKGTELGLLIEDASKRDHALVEMVSSAVERGDANSVETALSHMTDSAAQVAAARDAILRLADLGLKESALKLADGMKDASAQGRVLSELAR